MERFPIEDSLIYKKYKEERAKDANDKLLKSKLELVQELQLKADSKNLLYHVQTELAAIESIVESNQIGKKTQTADDLLSQLNIYTELSSFMDITEDNKKLLDELQGKASRIRTKVLEHEKKLVVDAATSSGIMGIINKFGQDLFGAVKDISWIKKKIMGISHIDNPLIHTAFRTYTTAMSKARTSLQELAEKIQHSAEAYKKYTGHSDYSLIIEGNKLVGEYTPEFWKQLAIAEQNRNFEWAKDNVDFDKEKYISERNKVLDYQESIRQNKLKELKVLNPTLTDAELLKELVNQEKQHLVAWETTHNNAFTYHTPKSKHINPRYTEIKEGKYKGTAVEEFYDLYRSTLEVANDLFPEHIISNFIPNFHKDFIEKTSEVGLLGAIKASWSGGLDNMSIKYDENLYGEIDSFTGRPIDRLFVPGLNEIEDKSMDLGIALFRFMEGVYRYKELDEVEETILAVQRQLRNSKIRATNALGKELPEGTVRDKNLTTNNTADAMDEWVKSALYNQKRKQEGGKTIHGNGFTKLLGILGKGETIDIEYAKIIDGVIRYTSLRNLGFNVYSPIVNMFGGISNMYMSGNNSLDYNKANLTEALNLVMQGKIGLTNDEAIKAKLIYEYFAIEQSDLNREITDKLSNSVIKKLLHEYNAMTLMKESENIMQRAGLIAMLKSNKHSINWDTFEVKDGKLEIKLNAFEKEQFRQKVIRVNAKNLGGVNPDDMASAKRYMAGRLIMQHRNWLPALYYERFGAKQYDYVLERDIEGRYKTAARLWKALFIKSQFETLTPLEQANLKSAGAEAVLLVGCSLLLMALRGVDDDDKKKTWYKMSNKISTRALGELTFFADPTFSSQYQILLSPFAAAATGIDAARLVKSIWTEISSDDKAQLKRNTPLKKAVKMTFYGNKISTFLEDLGVIDYKK